jgi:hypothetical protein
MELLFSLSVTHAARWRSLGAEAHLLRETMNSIESRLILRNGTKLTLSRGYREKLQERLGKVL